MHTHIICQGARTPAACDIAQVPAGCLFGHSTDNSTCCPTLCVVQHSAVMVAGIGATFQGNSGLYGGVVAAQVGLGFCLKNTAAVTAEDVFSEEACCC